MEKDLFELTEKIKKYYFSMELDSKKANLILKRRAETLSLNEGELNDLIQKTKESLDDGVAFIFELIKLNQESGNTALLEEDITEINEFLSAKDFDESDCANLVEYALKKNSLTNEENGKEDIVIASPESEEQVNTKSIDSRKKSNEQQKNEKSIFDPLLLKEGAIQLSVCKESLINRIGVNYNYNLLEAFSAFKEELFSVNNRNKFHKSFLLKSFEKNIHPFLEKTHVDFINLGVIPHSISQSDFFNLIPVKVIFEAAKAISEINSKVDQNIEEFKMYNNRRKSSTTMAVGSLGFMALVGLGSAISKGAEAVGNSFKNMNYSSSVDKQAIDAISHVLDNMFEELVNSAVKIYDFFLEKQGFHYSNYKELYDRQKQAYSVIENIRNPNLDFSNEKKLELLLETIYLYPHNAELYLELNNLIDFSIEEKLEVLNFGLNWVAEPTAKDKLDNSIYICNKCLYYDELKKLSTDDTVVTSQEITKLKEKYKIETYDSIKHEIALFGEFFSEIDVNEYIAQNDTFKEKKNFVEYVMTSIKELDGSLDKKIKLLRKFKKTNILDKFEYYEYEVKFFDSRISLEENEKKEFSFIDEVEKIYDEYKKVDNYPFGKEFLYCSSESFSIGKFINNFEEYHKKNKDKFLFSCRENTWIFSPKDGFVISSRYIYCSNWDVPIEISNISHIIYSEEEHLESGTLKTRFKLGFKEYGILYNLNIHYLKNLEEFSLFLKKIIQLYNPEVIHQEIKAPNFSEENEVKKIDNPSSIVSKERRKESLKKEYFKKLEELKVQIIELGESRYGINESIREKKINNFINKYFVKHNVNIEKSNVIGYCDTTVFGKGDQGFAITKEGIFVHSLFEKGFYEFKNMIKAPEKKSSNIHLFTKEKKAELSILDSKGTKIMHELISLLYTMQKNDIDIENKED